MLDSRHVETGRRQDQTVELGCVGCYCDLRAVRDHPSAGMKDCESLFALDKLSFKFSVSMFFLLTVRVNEVTFPT